MYERLYRSLYRIRRVEEETARAYPGDRIKSPVHLSIGQEAVSVGVCEALRPSDVVFGSYRGHALYLAKGGSLNEMTAELYGKAGGCSGGKGGSMHLIDTEAGVMGTSAVVGTTIPNAVGYAYAFRYGGPLAPRAAWGPNNIRREEGSKATRGANGPPSSTAVVASFFGDGATEEGVFAESLNFAVLKQLPILFVCENNQYAIHTHQSRRQGSLAICERARAHGVPAERIEDNDVLRLYERAQDVVAQIRSGNGPYFFEVMTYRWQEHVGPGQDYRLGYRTEEEARPWMENDQVSRLAALVEPWQRAQIEAEIEEEVAAAFAFAEAGPFPAAEELYTDVFKEAQHAC
jgi:TPP-dependent pyruvate/acetoin dehydrogenase alpha subunit